MSRVSTDYVRHKGQDGRYDQEYYSFGEGGNWGSPIKDATFDRMNFTDVARVVAAPLAEQGFVAARDPAKTRLLIMLYWGTTTVPDPPRESPLFSEYTNLMDEYRILLGEHSPEAESVRESAMSVLGMYIHDRDLRDFRNAGLIGYDVTGLIGTDYGNDVRSRAIGWKQRDLSDEIEENRYFVVLMAYDFQLMWKQKKHKLLWETRFSINEPRNAFDKALPFIAEKASRYFGSPSNGLKRDEVGPGRVELGDPTIIEFLTGDRKPK
ncbi:MAG TPA: hypothetical protein VGF85_13020 [Opitutaceae bacterium]